MTTEIPEWRIVDDAIWFAVNARFTQRGPSERAGRASSKYPLTGIAKCGACGGAVAASRVVAYGGVNERVLCYGCAKHHERGSAVCPVAVHQPMLEVENALIDHLQQHVLTDGVLQFVLGEIRSEIAAPARTQDGARSIWKISGAANFGSLVEENPPDHVATPTRRAANGTIDISFVALVRSS